MKALPSLFLALLMCVLSAPAQGMPADAQCGKRAASSAFDLPMRVHMMAGDEIPSKRLATDVKPTAELMAGNPLVKP